MRGDLEKVLFDEQAIHRRLDDMAAQISNDYRDRELTVIAVLHGSLMFVADLLRHKRAYAWISFFTLLSDPMVRHDARASVAQAFTRDEILRQRDRAGLGFAGYYAHFGHRFVLAGEKGG